MKFYSNLIGLVAVLLCIVATPVNAQGLLSKECTNYPAVAMTPSETSIADNAYSMTHSRVYHRARSTKDVLLFGPVLPISNPTGEGARLKVNYSYRLRGVGVARVTAELRFVSNRGGITIIDRATSTLRGTRINDVFPVSGTGDAVSSHIDYSRLDNADGYYIVRLYLSRSSSAVSISALGYQLCAGSFT